MVATTFPRWAGDGQGAFIWELARAVHRQGVEVQVVALHTPGAKTSEMIEGIAVARPRYWWPERDESLRKDGGGLPITLRKYPLARLQLPFFMARHSQVIAQHARHCDLVHAHWTLSGSAALLARPLHRKPVLVTVQGSDIFQVAKSGLGAWFTRRVLNSSDQVTALSHALKDAAIDAGARAEKIAIVPNGVDIHRFMPPQEEQRGQKAAQPPIILFTGFLIQRKGVRYLLEALALLPAHLPRYRAVIVGEGPEEEALRAQVAALGLGDRVEFAGFQPQAAVSEWMRQAHVFVLPSLEEGQGVVLLEALASGTPVVASDVDGIRDVVVPEVGYRVPPADPAALAAALEQMLTIDAAGWQRLSQQARQCAVDLYDWDKIGARFVEIYRGIQ
ncbi:MAG: glycosyltransferase [Caldilineaceae bacterium]|nr:glycosyltransferase [Caldilineaceae bacterium]